MKKIIPSAPFKNYEDIKNLASIVRGKAERIQIDICDGKYEKNISWPFTEYSKTDFQKIGEREDADVYLPFWEDVDYSADLMVENPLQYIQSLVAFGVDEVIIHFRSLVDKQTEFQKIQALCESFDLSLVLALDVRTDWGEFLEFAKKHAQDVSGFQVMGIENIGEQGQDFAPESLHLVEKLKANFPDTLVYFDGAINEDTIQDIAESGVDVFCIGSYLTKASDFNWNFKNMKNFLNEEDTSVI